MGLGWCQGEASISDDPQWLGRTCNGTPLGSDVCRTEGAFADISWGDFLVEGVRSLTKGIPADVEYDEFEVKVGVKAGQG